MAEISPKVTITHYADPWCWYCWGLEPVIQRLKEVYGDDVEVVYKSGGIFDDFSSWMQEEGLSNDRELLTLIKQDGRQMRNPFKFGYMIDSRPQSTWPSCLAVKAAEMQGKEQGQQFFRSLLEETLLRGRNASDRQVQLDVARKVGLEIDRFQHDLDDPGVARNFQLDRRSKEKEKQGMATLKIVNTTTGESVKLTGYDPRAYEQEIDRLTKGGAAKRTPIDIVDYIERRKGQRISKREISSVFSIEESDALGRLEGLAKEGLLIQVKIKSVGDFWTSNPSSPPSSLTLEQIELAHVTPSERRLKEVGLEDILKPVVKRLYTDVSKRPDREYHFPTGRRAALSLGYGKKELEAVPSTAVESFAGVNYPFAAHVIRPGDTVLDVGSGAGTDVLVSAQKTGVKGTVIGLDFTDAMIRKAKANISKAGFHNVKIMKGEATQIPLPDRSVDVVTTNGVLNLVVNKERALGQMYRVLRRGGHIQISDVLVKRDVTSVCGVVPQLWAECIGGAAVLNEFIAMMQKVGFADPRIVRRTDYFSLSPSPQMKRLARTFEAESAVITATKPKQNC